MIGVGSLLSGRSAFVQISVALLGTAMVFAVYQVLGLNMAIVVAVLPIVLFLTLQQTFILTIFFACFSYFRLHEAYPFLAPFRIIAITGAAVVGGLLWRAFILDGNKPRGQRELKVLSLIAAGAAIGCGVAFSSSGGNFDSAAGLALGTLTILAFCCGLALWYHLLGRSSAEGWPKTMFYMTAFMIVSSLGVPLAKYPSEAFAHWVLVYWKVVIVAFAIAWLARTESDFSRTQFLIVLSGCAIAAVAIYNKIYGIDLVEGTRVTIGLTLYKPKDLILPPAEATSYASSLGDPNELSMVLLFPLSFAAALIYYRPTPVLTLFACIALPALMLAIIFTQSRGGLLGVMAVGGVIGLKVVKSRALLIAGGVLAMLALYIAMGIGDRGTAAAGSGELVDNSSMGRIWAWMAAAKMGVLPAAQRRRHDGVSGRPRRLRDPADRLQQRGAQHLVWRAGGNRHSGHHIVCADDFDGGDLDARHHAQT